MRERSKFRSRTPTESRIDFIRNNIMIVRHFCGRIMQRIFVSCVIPTIFSRNHASRKLNSILKPRIRRAASSSLSRLNSKMGENADSGNRLAKFARTAEAKKSLPTEGDWEWGGCGDNVNFGFKKSRDFMDAPYRKRSDIKTLVKLHNNDAGRLVSCFYAYPLDNSHISARIFAILYPIHTSVVLSCSTMTSRKIDPCEISIHCCSYHM